MRISWTALALLCGATVALGQPAAPAGVTNEQQLDRVLAGWEKAMADLKSFDATCTDHARQELQLDRDARGQKLFSRAVARVSRAGPVCAWPRKTIRLFTRSTFPRGRFCIENSPANKVVYVHDMPKNGQIGDENFLSFLFGMKAKDAKERYLMTWVPDTQHNNKFYHYLPVQPRDPRDKTDFSEARLTLGEYDAAVPALVSPAQRQRDHLGLSAGEDQREHSARHLPAARSARWWRIQRVPHATPVRSSRR